MANPGSPGHPRRRPLRLLAITVTLALGAAVPSPAALARTSAEPGGAARIAKLTKEIKALEKSYGGNLEQLRDVRQDAKKAVERSRTLNTELAQARTIVAQLAASQYMSNGVDPSVQIVSGTDPNDLLDGAALASHVSASRAARVKQIQSLVGQQERTRREAEGKIEKLAGDTEKISKRKAEVQRLLKKYKPESPTVGNGGMTARMVKVRDEIETELGPFITIGCTRPGDPQDHGKGQACDFMESSAGSMPSAARMAHGDQVAAYAIKHASRLGVKYVIWRQRIYDMRSPGWETMSDRGSITQNHMDHNHISVF
ncbi:hypothetical protein GCM10010191_73310 [Actinomadura vinacea]|uniref:ARB-07466-like C-terminal domain-containing protein n=1 Tax=Actinomadura vinacea TaxID=115336 RepID=A0ABN3K098_9ACTN